MGYNWRQTKMKRFLIIIVSFMLCSWMTSCYTTQNVLLSSHELKERYVGKTKQQLIQMMGPPTRETTDGGDGAILVYEEKGGSTTKATYNEYINTTYYNTTQNPDKYAWFYLDSNGVCTYVKTNCLTKRDRAYNSRLTTGVVIMSIGAAIIVIGVIAQKAMGLM